MGFCGSVVRGTAISKYRQVGVKGMINGDYDIAEARELLGLDLVLTLHATQAMRKQNNRGLGHASQWHSIGERVGFNVLNMINQKSW